ncbi:DNA polymerase III subunit alpha [Spiroplasma endosymbiont of Labia minor]|uniref:DNA polymerase III subunit alpha n=1 Tax=Spiroplasma endosymbiont of Labia minor TaxID=3066305 RepID=UPI0030CEBAD2
MQFSPMIDIKTTYNFMSSLISIDDYFKFATENNFKFAFYAELNSMYGVAEFSSKAKKNGIKPIIGITIEIDLPIKWSINVFAKNRAGFEILSDFSSLLMTNRIINDGAKIKFINDNFNDNLIAVINYKNKIDFNHFDNMSKKMSSENIFLGIDKNTFVYNNKNQIDSMVNLVFYSSVNYFKKEDLIVYKAAIATKEGKLIEDLDNIEEKYYPDNNQIINIMNINDYQNNLNKINNMINFDLLNYTKKHLLVYPSPNKIPSKNYLQKIVEDSLMIYLKESIEKLNYKIYEDRMYYELSIINKMQFQDYFLIVWDYVKFAKQKNIYVGPGRGSVAGSLVSFLLNITTIDPIKYDLYFERFLNPERMTMPDIDIDFQDNRREEVIEYIFEKYGASQVATITTFSTIGIKGAIRDVGRVLSVPIENVNTITKLIDSETKILSNDELFKNKKLDVFKQKYPQLFEIAPKFIGLYRQTGTHAAGLIVSDIELQKVVPFKSGPNGINQTQFPMDFLEQFGLIKMDLLGLKNLTILHDVVSMINQTRKLNISLQKIPLNDSKTFLNLSKGNTSGIFQLESPGMTRVIEQMQIKNILDISIASSLYRPGPQEQIPEFIARRNNSSLIKYINNRLIPILEETYGVIVYQEQIMEILKVVANMSLSQADIIRRAIGKKDIELMSRYKELFIKNAVKNNYTNDDSKQIWDYIYKFASYGFNKSHAIAYSYISYYLAYFKTNYSAEFYAVMINSIIGNVKKTEQYIIEAQEQGIKIIPPSIKNINLKCIGNEKGIYLPLKIIKGISNIFIQELSSIYKNDKTKLDTMFKFACSMINHELTKEIFISLAAIGALDFYGWGRKLLIMNVDKIINFANAYSNQEIIPAYSEPSLDEYKDDFNELGQWEKEYLGFYLQMNPLTKYRGLYKLDYSLTTINKIYKININLQLLVIVDEFRKQMDKNNHEMAFLKIHDETGEISLTIFANLLEKYHSELYPGAILIIVVKAQEYKQQISLQLVNVLKRIL